MMILAPGDRVPLWLRIKVSAWAVPLAAAGRSDYCLPDERRQIWTDEEFVDR